MKNNMYHLIHILISALCVLGFINSYSQISNLHTFSGQPLTEKQESDDLQGSSYFTPDWRTGILVYENKRVENVKMRYDASADQVEIFYNNMPFIPNRELVREFEFTQLESGKLINFKFKDGFEGGGLTKKNYLSIIYEGKDVILAERIRMDKMKVTPAVYGEKEYQQFILARNYVLIKKGVAEKFKPSKKSFIIEFPDKEAKLKTYFKEKDVKFNDYEDLAVLMAYIEE